MKALLLCMLSLFTLPAMAQESFTIFQKGHWKVSYEITENGTPFCVADVTGDDVYFSLDVGRNSLSAFYITDHNNFGPGVVEGNVHLQIDHIGIWVTPAMIRPPTLGRPKAEFSGF